MLERVYIYDPPPMTPSDPSTGDSQTAPARFDADVAVVGAGLVGGALACALARNGVRTVVLDRTAPSAMAAPAFDGRASAIALSGQRLLHAIGVWSHLENQAGPIREIRVSDGKSFFFLHFDHADVGDTPLGFMVENRHLRAAIATEMKRLGDKLSVVTPASVETMSSATDSTELTLTNGRRITAELVVSAEGRTAALRQQAGIGVTGWTYPQAGIVTTITHDRPHHGIAHEHFLPAGPFAILPLPDDGDVHRSSLVWTERADAAASYMNLSDDAFLLEISERVGGFLGNLGMIGPRFSYPLGLQFAARYVSGRLVLVGDAAHSIHPIAGQGLNLGLRDVAALTEIIVEGKRLGLDAAYPDGMSRYERWRRSDNITMAAVTDVLNRLFSNDIGPVRLGRDLGLAMVNRMPPLKRLFMRHAMGTVGDLPRLMRDEPLT
ncbi:MAG: UbiH/UbiF/VisC/COQ6 family ubiquinone biosynthesis hydroxylase [Rhodospirillaceae bacterium]